MQRNVAHRIGFVGLGTMGSHMAVNLFKTKDVSVLVYDTCASTLRSLGLPSAKCLNEIAETCEEVVLCLPNGDIVSVQLPCRWCFHLPLLR